MKTILIIILLSAGLSSCLENAPMKTGFEGKKLPSFNFLLADSSVAISTDSLRMQTSFAIFYFSPDCPYCRAQIRDLIKHNKELKANKFLLITNYSKDEVQKITGEFKLSEYKNMITAIDTNSAFLKYYYIPNVPYLAIFDKEKKLKQALLGRTDYKTLKNLLSD